MVSFAQLVTVLIIARNNSNLKMLTIILSLLYETKENKGLFCFAGDPSNTALKWNQ